MTDEVAARLVESVRRAFDGTGYEVEDVDDGFRVIRERGYQPDSPEPRRWERKEYEFRLQEDTRQVTYFSKTTSARDNTGVGLNATWNKGYLLTGTGWNGRWTTASVNADVPAVVMSVASELGWTELPGQMRFRRWMAKAALVVVPLLLVLLLVALVRGAG